MLASTASSRSANVPVAGSACVWRAWWAPVWPSRTLGENSDGSSNGESASATARAISFRSSRMLPGHG
jgi:hypothetical protein